MAYLGLYALQHRGQESAGIATADGHHLANIKGMGLVSEIFTDEVLRKLPGHMAIGHTRYSTTGDSALLNAQPIRVESTKGLIAIAHNGNLVNLGTVRARLERDGAYFQTTSDSEIIVQLIAHSRAGTLVDAIADSLAQVEGAFSIVMMTRDRIFAARDPRGFRPLSIGRIRNQEGAGHHHLRLRNAAPSICFAPSTSAMSCPANSSWSPKTASPAASMRPACSSRAASSSTSTSRVLTSKIYGRWVQESRDQMGRQLARESGVPAISSSPCRTPA